jgi:hypothetical protein
LDAKLIIAGILVCATFSFGAFDLVFGDCDSLKDIPITEIQRDAICDKMSYGGGFESVFDLLELGVFTPEEFEKAKDFFTVGKISRPQTELERIDSLYFKVGDWLTGEGVSEELIDERLDAIRGKPVLSDLGYKDLVAMDNVSPSDAVVILKQIRDVGPIKDRRGLRSINGLSVRGYLSVRSYIDYGVEKKINWRTGGYVQGRFGGSTVDGDPYSSLKIHANNGPVSYGFRMSKDSGEPIEYGDWANPFAYPDFKVYAALTRFDIGELRIRHLIAGDYSAEFGEGVTFSSGDYFNPRNTGTGFDIRSLGVYPDLSASQTYALRGAAVEAKYGMIEPTVFFSTREKDAVYKKYQVITPDSFSVDSAGADTTIFSAETTIVNDSTGFADLINGMKDWKDKVKETIIGGDLTVSPFLNLRLGLTAYRANYDKTWKPDITAIVDSTRLPGGSNASVDQFDAEYLSSTYNQDYRSAVGANAMWAIGNLSFSGEYSEVVRDSNVLLNWHYSGIIDTIRGDATSFLPIGDDPSGTVLKAQLVTNRLGAVAVYRKYELGFDNPYNRGFSEYGRYKGASFEDDYKLTDPALTVLATETPRPMAEEGLYLQFYGKPFRQLDATVEFDAFKRLTDGADYRRIVLKANYRPHNNLSFRIWRKWQGRSAQNALTPNSFTVDEIRLSADARLSGYSTVGFTVIHSFMTNPPRPQYAQYADPTAGDPSVASVVDPSEGIILNAEINADEHLTILGQGIIYRGWLWNFEEGEFAELDTKTDAFRWWLAIRDRFVENLSVTAKLTVDKPLSATNIDLRSSYGDPETNLEGGRVTDAKAYWRIQLDYFF